MHLLHVAVQCSITECFSNLALQHADSTSVIQEPTPAEHLDNQLKAKENKSVSSLDLKGKVKQFLFK